VEISSDEKRYNTVYSSLSLNHPWIFSIRDVDVAFRIRFGTRCRSDPNINNLTPTFWRSTQMIGTTLILSPDVATAVATNTITYDLRAADVDRSVFSFAGLTYPTERKIDIGHQTDKNLVNRHVFKISSTLLDSLGVQGTGSVAFTVIRPANAAFTNAILIGLTNQLVTFLAASANANVTKLLNKEV
jgi:hypothetical protein